MRIAKAEVPVVHVGTTSFTALARNLAKSQGHADLPLVIVEHPFNTHTRDEVRTIANKVTQDIVSALLEHEFCELLHGRCSAAGDERSNVCDYAQPPKISISS